VIRWALAITGGG